MNRYLYKSSRWNSPTSRNIARKWENSRQNKLCAWINLKLFGIFFSGLLFRKNCPFLDFSPFCADILKETTVATRGPLWSQSRFREIVSNHLHFSNIVVVITQIIMTTFPFLRLFHRTLFAAASVPCPYSKAITLIVSWWDWPMALII